MSKPNEVLCNVLSISTQRFDGSWDWNDRLGTVTLTQDEIQNMTARRLFRLLRNEGWLTEGSKGGLGMCDIDWPQIVVYVRSNHEPIIAIEPVNHKDVFGSS